jgi:hypothetical protein
MLHIGLLRVMSNKFGTYVCIFSLTFFSAVVNVYFYSLISSSSTRPARPALELTVDVGVYEGPQGWWSCAVGCRWMLSHFRLPSTSTRRRDWRCVSLHPSSGVLGLICPRSPSCGSTTASSTAAPTTRKSEVRSQKSSTRELSTRANV